MYELPKTILIDDKTYPIRNNADYRLILDIMTALQDNELDKQEQLITALAVFYEDVQSIDGVFNVFDNDTILIASEKMMEFINGGDESSGYDNHVKTIDWAQDEKLIVSAVNAVAHTEIRALEYMHWWTFLAHYMAIGECALQTVVGIRNKIAKGKKLEKWEQEFKRNNPHYFIWKTDAEPESDFAKEIAAMWANN